MARLTDIRTKIEAEVVLTLNESEIRALDALAGYGIDAFLKTFYEKMGLAYLRPYEAGLRSLFETVRGVASTCNEADECRKFMAETREQQFQAQRKAAKK